MTLQKINKTDLVALIVSPALAVLIQRNSTRYLLFNREDLLMEKQTSSKKHLREPFGDKERQEFNFHYNH